MVTIPIYNDSEDTVVCEACRTPVPPGEETIPCLNTITNSPIYTCRSCFDGNPNYIRIDECMPSGDVIM